MLCAHARRESRIDRAGIAAKLSEKGLKNFSFFVAVRIYRKVAPGYDFPVLDQSTSDLRSKPLLNFRAAHVAGLQRVSSMHRRRRSTVVEHRRTPDQITLIGG